MTGNKPTMPAVSDWDPDEAPDLSQPEWRAKIDAAPLRRGGHPVSPNASDHQKKPASRRSSVRR